MSIKGINGILNIYEDRVEILRAKPSVFMPAFMRRYQIDDRIITFSEMTWVDYQKPTLFDVGYFRFIHSKSETRRAVISLHMRTATEHLDDPDVLIFRAFSGKRSALSERAYHFIIDKLGKR